MGVWAAQEGGVQHAWQLQVVDVVAPAGQDPLVLGTLHFGADKSHLISSSESARPTSCVGSDSDILSAANRTPSTIDW